MRLRVAAANQVKDEVKDDWKNVLTDDAKTSNRDKTLEIHPCSTFFYVALG